MLRAPSEIAVAFAGCRQEFQKVAVLHGVQRRRRLRYVAGRRRFGKPGQQAVGWLRERRSRTGRMCWATMLEGILPVSITGEVLWLAHPWQQQVVTSRFIFCCLREVP